MADSRIKVEIMPTKPPEYQFFDLSLRIAAEHIRNIQSFIQNTNAEKGFIQNTNAEKALERIKQADVRIEIQQSRIAKLTKQLLPKYPAPGSLWVWEPDSDKARCVVNVTDFNLETGIVTVEPIDSPGTYYHNDIDRWVEATVPYSEWKGRF